MCPVGTPLTLNDCIRNTTAVCNPRQNSVRDKIQSLKKSEKNTFLSEKKTVQKEIVSDVVLDFQCAK